MRKKHIIIIICLVAILLVSVVCYGIRVFPKYKGTYSIKDYEYVTNPYQCEKSFDHVENYWDAYTIAKTEVLEHFPNGSFSSLNIEYKREVYYDSQSDTWFVCFYPELLIEYSMIMIDGKIHIVQTDILDGGYYCIVSSNGEVIACWSD